MHRILNSTVPFSHMDQRDIKALNCPSSGPASRTESKGGERDKTNQNLWKAVLCGTADHEWTQRTEKQSIIAQAECKYWDWNRKTRLISLICQCFIQMYIWAKLFLSFYRRVPGFTGVLPQWQVKSYVTQTPVPLCSLLIPGNNISRQLTYFLTYIFHHKMGCILASPTSCFLEPSLAVGPERNAVRNIVENGERRTAKWVSPWESPECQNRTAASAFLHLSFRLDRINCKYCNYCRAEEGITQMGLNSVKSQLRSKT